MEGFVGSEHEDKDLRMQRRLRGQQLGNTNNYGRTGPAGAHNPVIIFGTGIGLGSRYLMAI